MPALDPLGSTWAAFVCERVCVCVCVIPRCQLSFLREEFGLTFCWGDHVVSVLQPGGVYAP